MAQGVAGVAGGDAELNYGLDTRLAKVRGQRRNPPLLVVGEETDQPLELRPSPVESTRSARLELAPEAGREAANLGIGVSVSRLRSRALSRRPLVAAARGEGTMDQCRR